MKWSLCATKFLTALLFSCGAFCSLANAQDLMPLLGSKNLIPVTLNEEVEKGKKPSSYYLVADTICKVFENGKEATYFWLCETNAGWKNEKCDYRLIKLTEIPEQVCSLRSYGNKIMPYGKCIGAGRSFYKQRYLKDKTGMNAIVNKYYPLSKTGKSSYSFVSVEDQWAAITDNRASVWVFEDINKYDVSDYRATNRLWFVCKDQTRAYIQDNEMIYTTVVKLIKPGASYDYSKLKTVTDKEYTTISLFRITKNLVTGYSGVEFINSFYPSGELCEMPGKLDEYVLDSLVNNKFKLDI